MGRSSQTADLTAQTEGKWVVGGMGKWAESVCKDKAPTVGKTLDFRTEGFEGTGKASSVLKALTPIPSLPLLFRSQERAAS